MTSIYTWSIAWTYLVELPLLLPQQPLDKDCSEGLGDGLRNGLGERLGEELGDGLGEGLGDDLGGNEGAVTNSEVGSKNSGSDSESECAKWSDMYELIKGEKGCLSCTQYVMM